LASIPWAVIENKSEREIAETFGRSAIVLSLPFLESFGLVPLEAMASGAIVIGFHGHGALEYATSENGFWFPSDHIEETADAIAHVIGALQAKDPAILKMLEAGRATVARYSRDAARDALRAFYGPMLS
jgi:glycosyltransferase involved in cell wall biosynthesis